MRLPVLLVFGLQFVSGFPSTFRVISGKSDAKRVNRTHATHQLKPSHGNATKAGLENSTRVGRSHPLKTRWIDRTSTTHPPLPSHPIPTESSNASQMGVIESNVVNGSQPEPTLLPTSSLSDWPYAGINISAVYKGTWAAADQVAGDASVSRRLPPGFNEAGGTLVFKLNSKQALLPGLHLLQGRVVVRNGLYSSATDIYRNVHGLFFLSTGEVLLFSPGRSNLTASPSKARTITAESSRLAQSRSPPSTSLNGHNVSVTAHFLARLFHHLANHIIASQAISDSMRAEPVLVDIAEDRAAFADPPSSHAPPATGTYFKTSVLAVLGGAGNGTQPSERYVHDVLRALDDMEETTSPTGILPERDDNGYLCDTLLELYLQPLDDVPELAAHEHADTQPSRRRLTRDPSSNMPTGALSWSETKQKPPRAQPLRRELPALPPNRLSHQLALKGAMNSLNCNYTITIEASVLQYQLFYLKALHYILVVNSAAVLQIILSYVEFKELLAARRLHSVSILAIGMEALVDAYACAFHTATGLVSDTLVVEFVTTSFLFFALFSPVEMRFLEHVWRSRHLGAQNRGWGRVRVHYITVYACFYGALSLGVVLMYRLRGVPLSMFMVSLHCFWIPQIVLNVRTASPGVFSHRYIIGMSLARLVLPLYAFACPKNFLSLKPDAPLAVCIAMVVLAQMVFLLMQRRYGALFFVPKACGPRQYEYHRSVPLLRVRHISDKADATQEVRQGDDSDEGETCCICCCELQADAGLRDTMVTPCQHVFHTECLGRWMEEKMECPTCRFAPLPAYCSV